MTCDVFTEEISVGKKKGEGKGREGKGRRGKGKEEKKREQKRRGPSTKPEDTSMLGGPEERTSEKKRLKRPG